MSNQYMYAGDQAIIIQDGALIWDDQSHDHSSLHYFDAHSSVIDDSTNDESYITAIDSNETQYLSILEQTDSNDITLEDLHNLTIENRDVSEEVLGNDLLPEGNADAIQGNNDEDSAGEVIVFTMDGSDDLYGIQLTHDEEGNVQKYQFKFRTTPDGQLEPIPETVTLLPNNIQADEQVEMGNLNTETEQVGEIEGEQQYILVQAPREPENCDEEAAPVDDVNIEHVYIKGECHTPEPLEEETEPVDAEMLQHCIDTVSNEACLETQLENLHVDIKAVVEHYQESQISDDMGQDEAEGAIEPLDPSEEGQDEHFLTGVEGEQSHEQLVQHFLSENDQIEVQYETELETQGRSANECQYNQLLKCEGNYAENYLGNAADNVNMDAEAETDEYITDNYAGEAAQIEDANAAETYPASTVQKSNVLKHALTNSDSDDKPEKTLVDVKYYVVYQEKENVNSLAANNSALRLPKLTKVNPRSVLRTSFGTPKEKRRKLTTNVSECDLYHKRFAKNKEAMQAKNFNIFLNRTTIPHAPVRQHRQPRKQKIRPMIERIDEEIIVQEVMVSSSGFVESLDNKADNRKVTAVVELSDSEDDCNNAQLKKSRRKTHHLLRNPSESEISIIEIDSDDETSDVFDKGGGIGSTAIDPLKRASSVSLKRRRGRPPKTKQGCSESLSAPQLDNLVISAIDSDRIEISCPFCPKTFPSQNSLNTHIIHHNLENSLKSKRRMNSSSIIPRKSTFPKFQYNHKCDDCQETFKNSILLQKHNCTKKPSSLNCSVCLKKFRDITSLNIHKKSHAKSNLVKNTSLTKVSPKRLLTKSSTTIMKPPAPKKLVAKSFKCTECPRVCDSEEKFSAHQKIHKKFLCPSCSAIFSSKLLLDTHVRSSCVKPKTKTPNKRLSFTIRKSFLHTPPRRVSVAKPDEMRRSVLSVKLDCDKCSQKFMTFRALYTHKVQKHGMSTPDKSLMTKPKRGLYKPRPAHGGIPANDRLKKAYAALRKKLAETENLVIT